MSITYNRVRDWCERHKVIVKVSSFFATIVGVLFKICSYYDEMPEQNKQDDGSSCENSFLRTYRCLAIPVFAIVLVLVFLLYMNLKQHKQVTIEDGSQLIQTEGDTGDLTEDGSQPKRNEGDTGASTEDGSQPKRNEGDTGASTKDGSQPKRNEEGTRGTSTANDSQLKQNEGDTGASTEDGSQPKRNEEGTRGTSTSNDSQLKQNKGDTGASTEDGSQPKRNEGGTRGTSTANDSHLKQNEGDTGASTEDGSQPRRNEGGKKEIIKDELIRKVASWFDRFADIDMLKVLLMDIIPKEDLLRSETTLNLLNMLQRRLVITPDDITILYDIVILCQIAPVLYYMNTKGFDISKYKINNISMYRRKLFAFGRIISARHIYDISYLFGTRHESNQWSLLLELELSNQLSEDNIMTFIKVLRRNGMEMEANALE